MDLTQSIASFPQIGPKYLEKLAKLHIFTVDDLLHHYPFRYADLSHASSIASLHIGDTVTLQGTITSISSVRIRSGKTLQKATFSDGTGILAVTWFNQPYLVTTFEKHPLVALSGTVKAFARKLTLSAPQYELITTNACLANGRNEPRTSINQRKCINSSIPITPSYSATTTEY